jgi:hypothetical protein
MAVPTVRSRPPPRAAVRPKRGSPAGAIQARAAPGGDEPAGAALHPDIAGPAAGVSSRSKPPDVPFARPLKLHASLFSPRTRSMRHPSRTESRRQLHLRPGRRRSFQAAPARHAWGWKRPAECREGVIRGEIRSG